jgi:hypothetical protein
MLRAILLLLVCMNLGVASWWAFHGEPTLPSLPALDTGTAPLTLLSESERAALTDSAELNTAPEPLDGNPLCLSIGPFATPADLRKAMNTLMPRVGRIQFREMAATAVRGYRVFLPAAHSRAQALETARSLAARGLTDYYVVTAGEQQNTVSLGIFRDRNNAQKRREEAVALGYHALLEARTERVPQWWVDVAAAEDFDWHALLPDSDLQAVAAACF